MATDRDSVLCVVVNRWRPMNIPLVVAALRAQSVPVHVSLVECSGGEEGLALPPDVLASADSVFTVRPDVGPCARFIPPLAMPWFPWTFFAVDDYVPGRECIKWMLVTGSGGLGGEFATIGQDGRRIDGDGLIVNRRIGMGRRPVKVDVVTSSELVETASMSHAARFHREVSDKESSLFEDDLILQFGIQRGTELPCYLTPAPPDDGCSWRQKQLPAPHALSARPDHAERRNRFVAQAKQLGWRSLV